MRGAGSWRGVRLFTIGHSTRTADELISILRAFDVSIVADIRTIPRSRHNPQFEGKVLGATLRRHQLRYVHLPALGGLRHARKDSPNPGWHNASFRGFADYMLTDDFEAGTRRPGKGENLNYEGTYQADLGELLADPGKWTPDGRTRRALIFAGSGIADVAAAAAIYHRARERKIGRQLPL